LKFKLGQRDYTTPFLVANIDNHILLGFDFFKENSCSISFKENKLIFPDQQVECCTEDGQPLCAKVQVKYCVTLAPHTEHIVCARLNRGILVATSLHEFKTQDVDIRVMNYTDGEVTLQAGQTIAQCSAVTAVEDETRNPKQPSEVFEEAISRWCSGLEGDEVTKARQLLYQNQDVFSHHKFDLGRTNLVKHGIPLDGAARPIKQRPYRHGPVQEGEIERQVKELKEHGLVKEGHGAWSSPVVLVKKKDGSWRFCVDYRKVNSLTTKDAYPLPRIDDSLDALGGSKLFSTLDLTSGYWQVELDDTAKEKSAFVTRSGLWEWQVLPFGLTSAPSTFERLMEVALRGLHWRTLLIYLDDIIVFSPNFETHLERLEEVFMRLRSAGLKLKPSKCTLFAERVHYLGHVVSANGVETDEDKVTAVRDWPTPTNKTEVKAFLGTCGYYRRFIADFSRIARPLSQVSAGKTSFSWSSDCQAAFDTLKTHLTNAPILAYPDYSKPFILDTDASQVAVGAVLSQMQGGQEKVIAYYSKSHSPEERNYCVTRLELLAVIKALKHFRPLLYGCKFKVRTDHASLQWLLKTANPMGQLARWMEILSEFDFDLEHRRGLKHNNADGLSRQSCENCKQCRRFVESHAISSVVVSELAGEQQGCIELQPVYSAVKAGQIINNKAVGKRTALLANRQDQLTVAADGTLLITINLQNRKLEVPVCPVKLRDQIIWQTHRQAHLGFNKTLEQIQRQWYWPGMTADIRRRVLSCKECQQAKVASHKHSNKNNHLYAGRPWQVVAVDLCGPFPETSRGNTQIMVLADHFTRWYDAIPIPDGQAATVATTLDERVFAYFGVPEVIHTDQGSQFQSQLMRACCNLWGCQKTHTAPYHPQGNSVVERLNRTLGNSLRALLLGVEHKEWDQLLPQIMRTIRATPHRITGESPNYMMLGRETRLPKDLLVPRPNALDVPVEEYVTNLQSNMTQVGNRLREQQGGDPKTEESEEPSKFKEGDKVWLKSFFKGHGRGSKLQPKYVGPYTVTAALPYQTYEVERNGKTSVQHEGRIRYYCTNQDNSPEGRDVVPTEPSLPEEQPCSPPTLDEQVQAQVQQQQSFRPQRERRKPRHLDDCVLDLIQTGVEGAYLNFKHILGQNWILHGGGVVNLNLIGTTGNKDVDQKINSSYIMLRGSDAA